MSTTTAPHLARHRCYVCGAEKHPDRAVSGGHDFWSNADAAAAFAAEDRRQRGVRYPSGATTPEADYVAQHRPY